MIDGRLAVTRRWIAGGLALWALAFVWAVHTYGVLVASITFIWALPLVAFIVLLLPERPRTRASGRRVA